MGLQIDMNYIKCLSTLDLFSDIDVGHFPLFSMYGDLVAYSGIVACRVES